MPIIAPQHQWKDKEHVPSEDWPTDCMVQWGKRGVVFSQSGSYATAFFEAFPTSGGFFRGEGADLDSAEEDALQKYKRAIGCEAHEWSRKGYTNGGGFCRKCGAFGTPFKPIVKLGSWDKPLSETEISMVLMGALADINDHKDPDHSKHLKRLAARFASKGIQLPAPPNNPISVFDLDDDPYILACANAIMTWVHEQGGPDAVFSKETSATSVQCVFDALSERRIRREYEDWAMKRESHRVLDSHEVPTRD